MPINNALTPEGQNALGAAFGYYPQLRRNRTLQDPRLAAEMPLQFLRGRAAATLGLPSDVANLVRTPMPMEMYGDVDYGPQTQVPYGSQELLRTLPLPPQGAAQSAAANVGAVVPLTPMEALQAARVARQAALATGRTFGPAAAGMAENLLQRQGLMPGVLPTSIANRSEVKNVADDFANQIKQMGFDVTLDHSGSKAGASSYLRVSDPQTGRFLSKPIRISDHSKGARELDANINVLNPQEDFAKITSALNDMRAKGDTLVFKRDRYAQELIASGVKPKTAYQRARTEIAENQPSPYFQEEALRLAQQRAALPVEQGGLGLLGSNTAEQRAKAMGFDPNNLMYHATDVDFQSIRPSGTGKMGAGVYVSPSSKYAEKYAGEGARVLPLVARGQLASDDVAMDIAESIRQKMAAQNPDFSVPEWKRQTTQAIEDAGYAGRNFSGLESVITNPENIRSRFAAFDPFRRNAAVAATMGVAAPDLLAAQAEQDAYSQNELRKFKRLSAR